MAFWGQDNVNRTVLVEEPGPAGLVLRRADWWDRTRARWLSLSLDADLAAGRPADADHLRAVRAAMLIAPSWRRKIAHAWERMLREASADRRRIPSAGPIRLEADRVVAAAGELRELVIALQVPQPVSPRGMAIATLLLTDGSGPLFNHSNQTDLGAAARAAVRYLDPL